jgi:DtxR family Mn-dependent transcriptional regulator
MSEPLVSLIIVISIIALAVFLFLPGKGYLEKKKKSKRFTLRIKVEDALKHLYDCEYKKLNCTLHSIAGNLSISGDQAAKIITHLQNMGLVQSSGENLLLTGEGRSYALRIVRIHRLWERYLADKTGTSETDWHSQAELKEHIISASEADKIAADLGNPLYDPHGDPIPTSSGEIHDIKGKPLNSMKPGETARIFHIEDEPPAVFAQLVAQGLYPGIHIRMISISKEKISFEANGEECILAPVLASGITVTEIPVEEIILDKYKTLASLKIGETAEVAGISKACRGQQRRRLMDLGIVPGSKVTAELQSFSGDPVAFIIRGAVIALRKQQAQQIFIK